MDDDHEQLRETNTERGCLTNRSPSETRHGLDKALVNCRPQLFRQAYRILGNREDAEDALQDAFLKAARHFDQFEGRSKLSTWLTRIVINEALIVRRGKHCYCETSLESLVSHIEDQASIEIRDDRQRDPEQMCASSEVGALIREQFNLLPPALRSAFRLRHIDGLSCEEARQSLGITVSAVKSRVRRAKRRLASGLNYVHCESLRNAGPAAGRGIGTI
ncbi:MAG: RNA polymerase sigma factor [Candidatus Sulfotelmatobacter sp.]